MGTVSAAWCIAKRRNSVAKTLQGCNTYCNSVLQNATREEMHRKKISGDIKLTISHIKNTIARNLL